MSDAQPQRRIFPDLEAASIAAARAISDAAHDCIEQNGRFCFVLAGGSTPRRLYALLASGAAGPIDWSRTHVFWGDERCVPPDDPLSNYRMAAETLLSHVDIPAEHIHRIAAEIEPPETAARRYAQTLHRVLGDAQSFDVTLLGMGVDGHTASLFPGSAALNASDDVVAVEAPEGVEPRHRITLTLRALSASTRVYFLVAGREKTHALRQVVGSSTGGDILPAARVSAREELCWFMDRAAARDMS